MFGLKQDSFNCPFAHCNQIRFNYINFVWFIKVVEIAINNHFIVLASLMVVRLAIPLIEFLGIKPLLMNKLSEDRQKILTV